MQSEERFLASLGMTGKVGAQRYKSNIKAAQDAGKDAGASKAESEVGGLRISLPSGKKAAATKAKIRITLRFLKRRGVKCLLHVNGMRGL